MCLRVPVYFGVHACAPARGHSRVRHMYVYTCFFLFLFARDRASERASERANALARAFLLIGKYRNARNIEHLDGTASMPLPHRGGFQRGRGTGRNRRSGAYGWMWVWVWRRFFRRQASAVRPSSLNEFDGFREIGDASGGSRDFRSTRGLHPREEDIEETLVAKAYHRFSIGTTAYRNNLGPLVAPECSTF